MKSHYRVVIIGGGIVGSSILYHLSKFGWSDVALIERAELTAGSTWHAAAGFHALNDDPNIAALQGYTIRLYEEIERESGQSVGMHMTGGISLAATPERWEMLKAERAMYETMEMETRLVTPEEIKELCPIVDVTNLQGGLFDQHEGYMDPHGTTHAYAGAAKKRGAEIILRNRVLDLMRMGALHDFDAVSDTASAAMLFAGQRVIVARIPQGWRLHVERPNAASIWQWLQRAASAWAKPPADASGRSQSPQLRATQQVAS